MEPTKPHHPQKQRLDSETTEPDDLHLWAGSWWRPGPGVGDMRQVLSLVVCGSSWSSKSQSGPKHFNWRQLDFLTGFLKLLYQAAASNRPGAPPKHKHVIDTYHKEAA